MCSRNINRDTQTRPAACLGKWFKIRGKRPLTSRCGPYQITCLPSPSYTFSKAFAGSPFILLQSSIPKSKYSVFTGLESSPPPSYPSTVSHPTPSFIIPGYSEPLPIPQFIIPGYRYTVKTLTPHFIIPGYTYTVKAPTPSLYYPRICIYSEN